MRFKEVTSSQCNLKRSSRGIRPMTPAFVLSFLKDELCILIFTSPAWRHLIKIKISWVICSGGPVEREQRVDEIQRKVSSLNTATASCLSLRPWRAAEDRGVHFEAWCVAVGQFYKVIKGGKKGGMSHHQSSPWLCRGEWPTRAQSEALSEGLKKKKKNSKGNHKSSLPWCMSSET